MLYKSCYGVVSNAQYCKLVSNVSTVSGISTCMVRIVAVVSNFVSKVSKVSIVNKCIKKPPVLRATSLLNAQKSPYFRICCANSHGFCN